MFETIRLALRLLIDGRAKSLGTLFGVVASVFLMAQQLSTRNGILERVTAFAKATRVDIWVAAAATESLDLTGTLPVRRVGEAWSTPGVAWAAPVVQGMTYITRPDGVREPVKVVGVEAPRYAGLAKTFVEGSGPAGLRGSGRVLLNEGDRPLFGLPQVGARIEIGGRSAWIGGFFSELDPHSPYLYVFSNLEDARAYTGMRSDRTTFVAVGVEPGTDVQIVRRRIERRIPDVEVFTGEQLSRKEIAYFLGRNPVGIVFGLGTAVAALIGVVIVAITMYSSVLDRIRDYGTLKAIGATRGDLIRLILAQAWLYFGVGTLAGLLVFGAVTHLATDAPIEPTPVILAIVIVASFASCTAASLLAVRRVLGIDPAIVFRG